MTCSFYQFVSLANPSISVDCEILRDCYESFAMYCFGRYLIACLGGEERTLLFMEREGRATFKTPLLHHSSHSGIVNHPFPLKYFLNPWKLGPRFFQIVKSGIVQYVCILHLSHFYPSFFIFSFLLFKSLQLLTDDHQIFHCCFGRNPWSLWSLLWRRIQSRMWVSTFKTIISFP